VTIDVDRLRRELEFVTAAPDRWQQDLWFELPEPYEDALFDRDLGLPPTSAATLAVDPAPGAEPGADWSCGTTACLAGWAAFHGGCEPSTLVDHVVDEAGRHRYVRDAARDLLGLTDAQASYLFAGNNNLRDLWELARVFTDGAVVLPAAVLAEATLTFDPRDEPRYRAAGDLP
jgi:hypothetical protein